MNHRPIRVPLRCAVLFLVCCVPVLVCRAQDDAGGVRPLYGEDHAKAQELRGQADRLRAAYEAAHRPGPSEDKDGAFVEVEHAYRKAITGYPRTEIAAYCQVSLAGAYMYRREHKQAVAALRDLARQFVGTEHESEACFTLGLFYLQNLGDPQAALAWFARVPAQGEAPESAGTAKRRQLFYSAQLQMLKCELTQGDIQNAALRYRQLRTMFADRDDDVRNSAKAFAREAQVDPAWLENPPPPPPTAKTATAPARPALEELLSRLGGHWTDKLTPDDVKALVAKLGPDADAAVERIVKTFWDPPTDYAFRHRALWALGGIASPKARQALLDIALKPERNFEVKIWRGNAAMWYVKTLEDKAEAAQLLQSTEAEVLQHAILGIKSQRLTEPVRRRMLELLRTPMKGMIEVSLRRLSAEVLAQDPTPDLGDRAQTIVDAIARAVEDVAGMPDADKVGWHTSLTHAEAALASYTQCLATCPGARSEHLKGAMEKAAKGSAAWECLAVARAKRGDAVVRAEVRGIVEDQNAGMFRAWAAEALGGIANADDVALLRELAEKDATQRPSGSDRRPDTVYYPVREAARRGLEKAQGKGK